MSVRYGRFDGLDAARQEAVDSARDIMSDLRREGGPFHGFAFNVTDDSGEQVMVYDFKNLLNGAATLAAADLAVAACISDQTHRATIVAYRMNRA